MFEVILLAAVTMCGVQVVHVLGVEQSVRGRDTIWAIATCHFENDQFGCQVDGLKRW